MTLGAPGIVAGLALSLFGGRLLGDDPPKAWADFTVDGDGSIIRVPNGGWRDRTMCHLRHRVSG